MTKIFSDDVRKVLLAGVGAVATAVEKTAGFVDNLIGKADDEKTKAVLDELSRKGEEAIRQGKAFGEDLKAKISEALKEQNVTDAVEDMSDEELDALLEKVKASVEARKKAAEEAERSAECENESEAECDECAQENETKDEKKQ